jgi:hypothetical protein
MFTYLKKTFYYEPSTYIVSNSKQEIIHRLDTLFVEKKGIFKSPNLRGHFSDYPNTFSMEPKWSIGSIQGFERRSAYLKGNILNTQDGKTKIEILVRPNSILGILSLAFLVLGLYKVFTFLTSQSHPFELYAGLSFIFIFVPIMIVMARISVKTLRQSFEKYLKISERRR